MIQSWNPTGELCAKGNCAAIGTSLILLAVGPAGGDTGAQLAAFGQHPLTTSYVILGEDQQQCTSLDVQSLCNTMHRVCPCLIARRYVSDADVGVMPAWTLLPVCNDRQSSWVEGAHVLHQTGFLSAAAGPVTIWQPHKGR